MKSAIFLKISFSEKTEYSQISPSVEFTVQLIVTVAPSDAKISLSTLETAIVVTKKLIFKKIADGKSINPTFRNSFRYHIDSDVETGNYDLQISNVTSEVVVNAQLSMTDI
jgi:hypothetical protein